MLNFNENKIKMYSKCSFEFEKRKGKKVKHIYIRLFVQFYLGILQV